MTVSPVSLGVYLSLMKLRSKQRLDYFALHSTGEKIYKMEEGQGEDKVGAMKGTELKTREDLKFSLEIYEDVSDFTTKSEVQEAIKVVSELYQIYRHVNVDLKIALGETEYLAQYPGYDDTAKKATEFLKKAQKHCKDVKNDTLRTTDNQRESLSVEREVLEMKVKQLTSTDVLEVDEVSEVEAYIRKLENFVGDYFDLCGKSKVLLGDDHDGPEFDRVISSLSEKVKEAKDRKKNLQLKKPSVCQMLPKLVSKTIIFCEVLTFMVK